MGPERVFRHGDAVCHPEHGMRADVQDQEILRRGPLQLISGIGFGLVALALHLPHFFAISIAILAVIAMSGATHDIDLDGLYMAELSKQDQAKYIGWQGAFYNFADFHGAASAAVEERVGVVYYGKSRAVGDFHTVVDAYCGIRFPS